MTRTLASAAASKQTAAGPGHPPAGLTWGIKQSFLRYLSGLPDGGHAASGGAYLSESSFFTFPPHTDEQTVAGELRFRGAIHLSGHAGLLQILIADPRLILRDTGALLTVANRIDAPEGSERIPLAELEINDSYSTQQGLVLPLITAELTAAGCDLFGGHYPAGEPLDPIFVFAPQPNLRSTWQRH